MRRLLWSARGLWQLAAPVDDFGKMTGSFADKFREGSRPTCPHNRDGITARPLPSGARDTWRDGSIMRRAFAMAVTAIGLAGCSAGGDYFSSLRSPPPSVQVQLESTPPGAEARTSLGPGCKTPCSVSVNPPDGMTSFLVNYSLAGRQPASIPVQVVKESGGMFSYDTYKGSPNPVVAELPAIGPPPKPAAPMRPKRK